MSSFALAGFLYCIEKYLYFISKLLLSGKLPNGTRKLPEAL